MLKGSFNIISLIFILAVFCSCVSHSSKKEVLSITNNNIVVDTKSSTVEIVIIKKNGHVARCTAFAYKRFKFLYKFITAAHCVAKDNKRQKRVVVFADKINIVLKNRRRKTTHTYSAKLIAVGYGGAGDDLAILEVNLDEHIPILLSSHNRPVFKECVFSTGYRGEVFYGHVHKINYTRDGNFIIKMLSGEVPDGVSGSAVVSCYENKIIGVLVAVISKRPKHTIVIPIDKFLKFERKTKEGKYKFPIGKN